MPDIRAVNPVPSPVPAAGDSVIPIPGESPAAPLATRVGHATRAARGKSNEDFYGLAVSGPGIPGRRGAILVLADGVSGNGKGRVAAEITVRSLLSDFYAVSTDWTTAQALEKLLGAANDWILAHNRSGSGNDGVVAAASALVLRGAQYFIAHVGNTRIYRLRGPAFECLTVDHTWPRRDMRNVLKRAVGLDTHLVVDFSEGELAEGDTFLVASDGVWEPLGDRKIRPLLLEHAGDPQRAADALVSAADAVQATYLGRNDASAFVMSICPAPVIDMA
jgi:serine/threonine protein phosphatase PrpC